MRSTLARSERFDALNPSFHPVLSLMAMDQLSTGGRNGMTPSFMYGHQVFGRGRTHHAIHSAYGKRGSSDRVLITPLVHHCTDAEPGTAIQGVQVSSHVYGWGCK